MSVFEAIKYVGTPLSLIAFIVAAGAYIYKKKISERRRLIEIAPENERALLVESAIKDLTTIRTDRLTRPHQYKLALKLIEEKSYKLKIISITSVVFATILATVIVIIATYPATPIPPPPTPTPTPKSPIVSSGNPTALCKDGTYSNSQTRSGTCSGHGGVKEWLPGAPAK